MCVCQMLKPVGGDRRLHLREEGWVESQGPTGSYTGIGPVAPK